MPLVFERVSDQASCAMSTDSRLLNIRPTVTALAASFALWATVWVRSCGGQRDTRTGPTAATTTFQRLNYIIFVKMINDCYITISGANYRSHYEILSNNDFPTFFKITLGENSGNFARRIVGGKIYTNTSYYIIAKNQKIIQKIVDLGENIAISAVDEINALGSTIYGATLEILSVTPDLSNLFSYFNYSLEVSENITPLWPPLYSVDGVLCSNKKKVYLLSSFTLVPHPKRRTSMITRF